MITLLGSLLGFGTSIIPQILGFFTKKNDQKHELALMDKRMEMAAQTAKHKVQEWNVRADIAELKSLYKHDSKIKTDSKFINFLRASIRPVITYCFFAMFVVIKCYYFYEAMKGAGFVTLDDMHYTIIGAGLEKVWDNETQALFSAVIGFWFGSRTIEKAARRK